MPEPNMSSSSCSSSQAFPPVILLNIRRISLSTMSKASRNVCFLSLSMSSMNRMMPFLSSSSEFFLADMERYPYETSRYVWGAFALSAESDESSDDNPDMIDSTSNVSVPLWNPNAVRTCFNLDSFSVRSRRSRPNRSDWRSMEFICRVISLSFSESVFRLSSNSWMSLMEEPEPDINSCSVCLKLTRAVLFDSLSISSSWIFSSRSWRSTVREFSSVVRRDDSESLPWCCILSVVSCDAWSVYWFMTLVCSDSNSDFILLASAKRFAVLSSPP